MEVDTHRFVLTSLDETRRFGERLAGVLSVGDVVGLEGELGAGKTTLVQAIARGLGVPDDVPVTSPTFTMHQVYEGRLRVDHFDLYRVVDEADLASVGAEDHMGRAGVSLVEWFDRMRGWQPPDPLVVRLTFRDESSRGVELCAVGARGRALLAALRSDRP